MYELGVAHALGKPTIMLAQSAADLPFDIKSYPVQLYSTHFQHARSLLDGLREIGESHLKGSIRFGNPVTDFLSPQIERASSPSTHVVTLTEQPEADYGRLDFEADMEQYGRKMSEELERFSTLTSALGEELTLTAPRLAEARRSTKPGSAAEAKRIANEVAMRLEHYSETLRIELTPELHMSLERVIAALTWVTSPYATTSAKELGDLADTASLIDRNVDAAMSGVQQFRNSVPAVRGQTTELNRAAVKTEIALDSFLNELSLAKAYFSKLKLRFDSST